MSEEPDSYVERGNGNGNGVAVRHVNGDMFQDTLNSMPNGRSSGSSWDYRSSRNGSALSVNGTSNGVVENGRRSPGAQNGLKRLSNGDRNSAPANTVLQSTESSPLRPISTPNGDKSEPTKRVSIPPPVSTNPQSTGPLTYTSSLLPASPLVSDSASSTPSRAATASPQPHRFSSPPAYPSSALATSHSTSSLPQHGLEPLRHRHTLQVPRPGGPGRTSRDGDDSSVTTGRFSPTSVVSTGVRRGSLSLNRRQTQSIHSNMPRDEVAPDEDTLRWAAALKEKRESKRKRKADEDEDRVVVGTRVGEGHVNFVAAYNMLTGIRYAVSRTNAKIDRQLTDADYDTSHKFSFDM